MTRYDLPREALDQIGVVAELENRARQAQQAVEHELKRVQVAETRLQKNHEERLAELKGREQEIEDGARELEERHQAFDALVDRTFDGVELVGRAWADYEVARAKAEAFALVTKSHPAPAAAEAVREKGRQLAEATRRAKAAEWTVELYEWQLPWITELREAGEAISFVQAGSQEPAEGEGQDPAAHWLSRPEWESLSTVERNQMALDRYLRSRKAPWQLGRDYERYVGYLREQAGCTVTYHGIFKGLEDLGRDVLAEKDGAIEVIQCKRWAQRKTIHEKHVFQLYGTTVLAKLENPDRGVAGTFTTTTSLSPKAREVADYLGIRVEEKFPLDDYPRIKCNIGQASGEKIYHLPFDQQYDTTVIAPERGERYASTVAEAEDLGFRRAWRWRGTEAGSPGT